VVVVLTVAAVALSDMHLCLLLPPGLEVAS
jgi:hypothetical protein